MLKPVHKPYQLDTIWALINAELMQVAFKLQVSRFTKWIIKRLPKGIGNPIQTKPRLFWLPRKEKCLRLKNRFPKIWIHHRK